MKALWLENRQLSLRDIPEPGRSGEALVKVRLAGICATDLELVKGYYRYTGVPGHEFVGEVVASPVEGWIGRRVVGEINAACGDCETCRNGRPTHCERRSVLGIMARDGVFAEYASLPPANLHPVPDNVTDEMAVFTEPLAAALEILEQVPIRPADRVLLVGAGRLGQLIARVLKLAGCELGVVARHPAHQDLLHGCGVRTLDEREVALARWDVVVEATGSPAGFAVARRAVRPRGTMVLKSTYAGELAVDFSAIVVDEINLVGSRCGPFAPALRLLAAGLVDPTPLVAARHRLDEAVAAFGQAAQPGVLKVLLKP